MAQQTDAETGIDFNTNGESDIEAWIDGGMTGYDGEHAVVWSLRRVEDSDLIEIRTEYCEAGMREEVGGAEVVESELTVSEYARENILPGAEGVLDECKEYWSDK